MLPGLRPVLITFIVLQGCAPPAPAPKATIAPAPATLQQERRRAMGTQVDLTLWAPPGPATRDAIDAAYTEMHRLEQLMTSWPHPGWPQSDVARLNEHAGDGARVPLAPETFAVIALAQQVAQVSAGAFDITYAPLRRIWHFDEDGTDNVPSAADVAKLRSYVGYADLELHAESHSARLRRAGMQIDLGGIAKGAIVDAAAQTLRARGFSDFIVKAGGDLYVSGQRSGRPWRVGIQDPRRPDAFFASLALRDHAFSTAGDYERGFVTGGQRYHHILDPRTGFPATASRSVTVYAPSALLADALDNAVFILGARAGAELLRRYPGCEAVMVDAEGVVQVTEGLQSQVLFEN